MRPEQRIVREAYKDAWRLRQRTGQDDEELLQAALRLRCAAAPFLEDGHPSHDALAACWRQGVAPEHLDVRTLVEGAGLRSPLAAVRQAAGGLVPRQRRDPGWMDLPRGHRALSTVRRANDVVRRHLHKPVDLVPLSFAALPGADTVLARGLSAVPARRGPWSQVRVWLCTGVATGFASVQVGDETIGSTTVPHLAWEELRDEAQRDVYADGTLEVTAPSERGRAVSVGTLRCHLPRG